MKILDEHKLKKIIIANSTSENIKETDIDFHTDLIEDYGFSSISIIQLVVEIENEFNIEFEDDDLLMELLSPYKSLVEIMNKYIESKETIDG